jgi:Glyoxalase-like domain
MASLVSVTATIASITFDSTDPVPLARWWADRFDAEITANMDGFFVIVAGGSLPAQLAFQLVDDPTPGKNKVHLDIHTDDDLDTEVARWTAAGATSLGKRNAGDFSWVTLADPDGNEFCIAAT